MIVPLAFIGVGDAAAAPASADQAFITANQQSNLAEIAIGTLAKNRAQDAATSAIADKTYSDHVTAKAKLAAVATKLGATTPTAPNAMQATAAAQLKATSSSGFDLAYAQLQVSAHQQALALARQEQAATSDAGLKSYTAFYISIASMHLTMAQHEVAALGGSPISVPAGSGGLATTASSLNTSAIAGLVGGSLLVLVGFVALARRRRIMTSV